MLTKRIIPCLDIKDGRTVKGVNFVGLRDAGDPVELARTYAQEGADELVFLDITATDQKRKTLIDLVSRVAEAINIPFTVGGGISQPEDVKLILEAGADKISVNSAAVHDPALISRLADRFGEQCVVLAVDARQVDGEWVVYVRGGKERTGRRLLEWATEAAQRGAGELLFTSMDHDGTKGGFANQALQQLSDNVGLPVIASGGAGTMPHFRDAFVVGKADAALAASVFHFGEIGIPALKQFLRESQIPVR
jgi:cyclase